MSTGPKKCGFSHNKISTTKKQQQLLWTQLYVFIHLVWALLPSYQLQSRRHPFDWPTYKTYFICFNFTFPSNKHVRKSQLSRSTQEFRWLAWNYLYCWSFSEQPAVRKAVQMTTWWRIRNMGMFSICLASPTFWARRNICDKKDTRKRRSTLNKVGDRDESYYTST